MQKNDGRTNTLEYHAVTTDRHHALFGQVSYFPSRLIFCIDRDLMRWQPHSIRVCLITHVLCAKDRSSVLGGVADWQAGIGSKCAEGPWVSPVIGISQMADSSGQ